MGFKYENISEFRVGNICNKDNKGYPKRITDEDIKYIPVSTRYHPVLILNKFILSNDCFSWNQKERFIFLNLGEHTFVFEIFIGAIHYTKGTGEKLSKEITYIHELQNLIYDLIGEMPWFRI